MSGGLPGKMQTVQEMRLPMQRMEPREQMLTGLLEDTLNLKDDTKIYERVMMGMEIRVLNKKETMLASQKQDAMKAAFKDWIFKDQQRRERLVKFIMNGLTVSVPVNMMAVI